MRSQCGLPVLRQVIHSYAFRVTLLYVIGLSLAVFTVLVLAYSYHSRNYFDDFGDALHADLAALSTAYRAGGVASLSAVLDTRRAALEAEPAFLLVNADLQPVAGGLPPTAQTMFHARGWLAFRTATLSLDTLNVRTTLIATFARQPNGSLLIVARDVTTGVQMENIVVSLMIRSLLVTLLIGLISGVVIGTFSLRQLAHVNRSIHRIMAGDLSERINAGHWHSDVRDVTDNFNRLLDRIQGLMISLRQVSDNIAHDLRTPLTRLRNQLASLQMDAPPGQREQVQAMLNEADGLLATFNALLRIAQIEAGSRRSDFAATDIGVIIRDVVELYEPLAADKLIVITCDSGPRCEVAGDRDLLFQALANLLDNAIKYTPAVGMITVISRRAGDRVRLVLADSGIGIAAENREKVFRRFFRVEASRSQQPGNGLGLSLVQAVVNLHRGTIWLEDNAPGLRVVVELPVVPPAAPPVVPPVVPIVAPPQSAAGSSRQSVASRS